MYFDFNEKWKNKKKHQTNKNKTKKGFFECRMYQTFYDVFISSKLLFHFQVSGCFDFLYITISLMFGVLLINLTIFFFILHC